MNKVLSLVAVAAGVLILAIGFNLGHTLSAQGSMDLSGALAERAHWLFAIGVVLESAALFTLFRVRRAP